MNTNTEDNRRRLINLAKGKKQYYCIEYCIDVKGNITIFGGDALGEAATQHMFVQMSTEQYVWLYDGWHNGGDFVKREREAADATPKEAIVDAYLKFRAQHPNDGYGMGAVLFERDKDKRAQRDDIDAIKLELKRRNRQYIAELYGETLPLDYDFKAAYEQTPRQ